MHIQVNERHMSDTLLLAIGLQIRVTTLHRFGKQQISVLGCRQVGDTITAEEQCGLVSQIPIRQDGLGFVVAETTGRMPKDNFPSVALAFWVGELDVVGDDVNLFSVRAGKEGRENASDVGSHTAGFDEINFV